MNAKSELAKLALNMGKEVSEGLAKKAEPIVAKAVPKVKSAIEGWGFQPKPGQIASEDFVKARTRTYSSATKDEKQTMNSYLDRIKDAANEGKLNYLTKVNQSWIKGSRIDIVAKQFATLEKMGVPRKYTGKIFNLFDEPEDQIWTAKQLKKLNPPERDIYMHLLKPTTPSPMSRVKSYSSELTRPQQETFASLLPEWSGTMEELVQAAKNL